MHLARRARPAAVLVVALLAVLVAGEAGRASTFSVSRTQIVLTARTRSEVYQGPYGRYAAAYQNVAGTDTTVLGAAGGVVAMDGHVFATRPVTDSFALIRVAGVAGVRGYLNNQPIGRTDARGNLLVPDLLAYYGNRLGIADQDVPLDHTVDATERTVATPFRGGAVVAFPVQPVRAVTGRLVIDGPSPLVPAFGQLTVTAAGRPFDSPIGRDGEFYLDGLPPGRHQAVIEHGDVRCPFLLEVPQAAVPVVDLGTQRCRPVRQP